ncbi:MAG TPA: hypothetical protein PKX87_08400 [Alphaproteobacteria bacterium]|nr:hypothetical protein [Alphaproteobacteria bacterium]
MNNSDSAPGGDNDVRVFHRINRLRIKTAGKAEGAPGQVDPERIRKADEFIGKLCADCRTLLSLPLEKLVAGWGEMKGLPDGEARKAMAERLFLLAHEIKDVGGMCGYALLAYFAESLRDYVMETTLAIDAHRVIVQAHVDALQAVFKADLKDPSFPEAEALKVAVRQAIEKYR